ncbi:hypothetical protein [Saccharothrix coeruleofusca]|uniref:Secreted protein with PEP-CTERM sorting signal n=1 Tax=Saccharothrix coeruleofusca TaxID=33919 RepID=A0A918AQR2_9PSEU|nr:hypothetical protein [Saccharothrix coeruleofusca]MBP2339237.1 energy-converting hydrogenase Eha subunit E [Saccharothrix coeruleofusca]GGP59186.1 hypothetical protein GCM10010185_34620 [Saccharothrix coeruleofusca]
MRGPGAALGLVVGTTSALAAPGVAVAADGTVAAGLGPLNAPVGLAAVTFGAVGMVAGLVRRRRAVLRAAEVRTSEPQPETQPAASQV